MEAHPPLGKLLIAAGEKLAWIFFKLNSSQTFQMELHDKFSLLILNPDSFSFVGYRLFPVLFASMNSALLAFLLLRLTASFRVAAVVSSFYLFDNALITQSRGALLEPFLIFGVLVSLIGFFGLISAKNGDTRESWFWSFLMVFGFSFAVMTKALGLILLLLWPILFFVKKGQRKKLFKRSAIQAGIFVVFFAMVWQIHFSLGQHIAPELPIGGTYFASSDYEKELLHLPSNKSFFESFYFKLRDNLRFFWAYEARVPAFHYEIGDVTSGSLPITWPFGSRPLHFISDPSQERYLYAIANPVIWLLCLLALVLSVGTIASEKLLRVKILTRPNSQYLQILLVIYFAYMLSVMNIRRTLYLTHYFIPLILCMLMAALILKEILLKHPQIKTQQLAALPLLAIGAYFYFSPLTYYQKISCADANERAIFRFWDLHFLGCADPTQTTIRKPTQRPPSSSFSPEINPGVEN